MQIKNRESCSYRSIWTPIYVAPWLGPSLYLSNFMERHSLACCVAWDKKLTPDSGALGGRRRGGGGGSCIKLELLWRPIKHNYLQLKFLWRVSSKRNAFSSFANGDGFIQSVFYLKFKPWKIAGLSCNFV